MSNSLFVAMWHVVAIMHAHRTVLACACILFHGPLPGHLLQNIVIAYAVLIRGMCLVVPARCRNAGKKVLAAVRSIAAHSEVLCWASIVLCTSTVLMNTHTSLCAETYRYPQSLSMFGVPPQCVPWKHSRYGAVLVRTVCTFPGSRLSSYIPRHSPPMSTCMPCHLAAPACGETLRGAGMMDCKKALAECSGDYQKASEYLRIKGMAVAGKKAGRTASEGVIAAYVHTGNKCAPARQTLLTTPEPWMFEASPPRLTLGHPCGSLMVSPEGLVPWPHQAATQSPACGLAGFSRTRPGCCGTCACEGNGCASFRAAEWSPTCRVVRPQQRSTLCVFVHRVLLSRTLLLHLWTSCPSSRRCCWSGGTCMVWCILLPCACASTRQSAAAGPVRCYVACGLQVACSAVVLVWGSPPSLNETPSSGKSRATMTYSAPFHNACLVVLWN